MGTLCEHTRIAGITIGEELKERLSLKWQGDRVQLHVPIDKLAKFAERNRLGSYHKNRGAKRSELENHADVEIIARYNAQMRGLVEYYKLGTECVEKLDVSTKSGGGV